MSEDLSRGIRDFSEYDTMDTAELNEILRKDCSAPEGEESDTELLLYVMEVLADRRKKTETAGNTTGEAWESFKENYYPVKAEETGHGSVPWLRRVIAAAAVLILVICVPITAHALNWEEIWNIFAHWAKETFSFVSGEDAQVSEPEKSSAEGYTSLQDALIKSNRDPSIVPVWIPEGFVLHEVKKDLTPVREIYFAIYSNSEKSISIRIHNHIAEDFQKAEISNTLLEVYKRDGVEYYIFTNFDQLRVTWIKDTYECMITGNLSIEEIKQMIDSIGKG